MSVSGLRKKELDNVQQKLLQKPETHIYISEYSQLQFWVANVQCRLFYNLNDVADSYFNKS